MSDETPSDTTLDKNSMDNMNMTLRLLQGLEN